MCKARHIDRPRVYEVFGIQNMGVNKIRDIINEICASFGITGNGARDAVTAYIHHVA